MGEAELDWQPVETAPKTGQLIWTKQVLEDGPKLMVFGPYRTVWSTMADDAPMRQWTSGGLDGPIPPDNEYADRKQWLTVDRRKCVPGPTHWAEYARSI